MIVLYGKIGDDIMVKYRPHRGTLDDAMLESREFNSIESMFKYIVEDWNSNIEVFDISDLSLTDDNGKDNRTDWKETRYICTRRMGTEKYKVPQCIGMCSIE